MKREEALSIYPHGWYDDLGYNDYGKRDIVNKIYDDFESRTCGNCKYFNECEDGFNYCDIHPRLNGFMTPDFGCNKFERKGE